MNNNDMPVIRLMLMLLVISNFILCSVLIATFIVPPSAVMSEVKKQATVTAEMNTQLTQLVEVVEHQKHESFDETEFRAWQSMAQELNPNIHLPTLDDVMR